jgi:hypothetical protein
MRIHTLVIAFALGAAALLVGACSDGSGPDLSGLPACGPATLLSVTPMALSDIREIAPLGNLNPPGHTFPTDHIYFYPTIGPAVPIASPGAIRITQAMVQKRTGNGQPELDDYGLDFYPCTTQHFYFAHLASLAPSLATELGSLEGSCNAPYMTGGFTYTQCRKNVSVELAPGASIGTAGGPTEGALDLGLIDHAAAPLAFVDPARVNDNTLHAACPVDAFVTDVRDSLLVRMAVNGVQRTIPPLCGTVMQDVVNTAQGRWYFDATAQEDHHLALVHQNWDPTIGAFSIGTSVPGTGATVLMFTPAATGRVNRDFNVVSADGKIYCYQLTNFTGHVFAQLVSASQVKIEVFGSGATCGDSTTWAFTGSAATFAR